MSDRALREKELKGFQQILLKRGEAKLVSVQPGKNAFKYFNEA